jgi:hypothetical protein
LPRRRAGNPILNVLLATPSTQVPLSHLSEEALAGWLLLVARCSLFGSDILEAHEVEALDGRLVEEWVETGLALRLPYGHLRVLGSGWLWEFERHVGRAA